MNASFPSLVAILAVVLACVPAMGQEIPGNRAQQIRDAAPAQARVQPAQPRRVLIFNTPPHLMPRDPHAGYCIPYGEAAMVALGEKTGAFVPVVSDDVAMFLPDNLRTFDAVVLNNTSGNWIVPSDEAMERLAGHGSKEQVEQLLRRSLLEWLREGHGLMAYHFAIGANRHWPEFTELLGAVFWGHPWNETITIQVDDPDSPLTQAFAGQEFRIGEETFMYNEPYARDKLRVLISMDTTRTNMAVPWIHRTDGDFALAWVKPYGQGRVFYTALGHRTENYWNPTFLQFLLDGAQFATGDLEAPTEPLPATPFQAAPGRWEAAMPSQEEAARIQAAAPEQPPVRPGERRRVLVFGRLTTHDPNAYAAEAIRALGKQTGAFDVVVSDNPEVLLPESIRGFHAVVMNNLHEREPFLPRHLERLPAERQQALRERDRQVKASVLDYVRNGGGLVGIHAATAACQGWPEYGEMIGGYYAGHIFEDVTLRNEEPGHPVAAPAGEGWTLNDEIYIFGPPHDRRNLRVLLSLDLSKMADPGKREDQDYAVSWVRPYGQGRVFYTTLGHAASTYWNPKFLSHLLAGIQFATGDLPAEAAPR